MDWRPTRWRRFSILYFGELALVSWTISDLTGYHNWYLYSIIIKLIVSCAQLATESNSLFYYIFCFWYRGPLMEICNKESSMSSFNEFQSLIFIHFKSLAPLSGQALVTDRLWATADNFTRFGNITLSNESNHSVGVFPGYGNPVQRTWGVLTQT